MDWKKLWPKVKFVLQIIAFIVASVVIYLLLSPLFAAKFAKEQVMVRGKFKVVKVKSNTELTEKGLDKAIKSGLSILSKIKPTKKK